MENTDTQSLGKIRIIYVIPTLDYGGAERQLLELCRHIDKDVFDPTIVLLRDRDRLLRGQYQNASHVKIIRIGHSGKYNLLKLFELRRIFKQLRPHIVHTFLPSANFWGSIAAKLAGSKILVIVSSRGLYYRCWIRLILMNFISFKFFANLIVVNSQVDKESCADFLKVNPKKLVMIRNALVMNTDTSGFDRDRLLRNFGIDDPTVSVISTVGRLTGQKSPEYFIKMAHLLSARGLKAKFLMAGSGPMLQSLQEQVDGFGLTESVVFLGDIENVKELLFITDVFVLHTLAEGCSNAILEAMAMACPIVTTAIPENKELIQDKQTGLLVPPKQGQELAGAVVRLLDDAQFAQSLAENARQKTTREFNLEKMIKSYEELYQKILAG